MIKILSAEQFRNADRFTIEHEPVAAIDLMERAAQKFCDMYGRLPVQGVNYIFCGHGNNGGDGLAIARILKKNKHEVNVFILKSANYSDDFLMNLSRLKKIQGISVSYIESENDFLNIEFQPGDKITEQAAHTPVIVDALYGTGLNKPVTGIAAKLIAFLNRQNAVRIAVDIPSGLSADHHTEGICFQADHTITFHAPKLSFFFPENYKSTGDIHVADIQLDKNFISSIPSQNFLIERRDVQQRIKPRKKFDHKGTYGHAFIHAGNTGKMGAAILCAKACARMGAGLTTVLLPENQSAVMNISVPEVMTEEYQGENIPDDFNKYTAFAFGPGIGTTDKSKRIFLSLMKKISSPVVLDADALNILSKKKNRWKLIPKNSILTPHLKEFERLAGKSFNWEERHRLQVRLSEEHSLCIVLKGANTCITTPNGISYFNSTGNPGMAKGGSGDVLTGMIVSLLAQNYSPEDACIAGVYLHGLAADLAVKDQSEPSLLATDIINNIGNGYNSLAGF